MVRTPEESLRGLSLLATHMIVSSEVVLYQIPTYRLLEPSRLKKPSLKTLPLETIVSGSLMKWVDVMVSMAEQPNTNQKQVSKRDTGLTLGLLMVTKNNSHTSVKCLLVHV